MGIEDVILLILPLIWGTFFGIPFIGIRVYPHRRDLFEKISRHFFKFASLFTLGSFVILIGEERWKAFFDFLITGHMYLLIVLLPSLLIIFSFYFIYAIWRDLLDGLRGEGEIE